LILESRALLKALAIILFALAAPAQADQPARAPRPPMGWNSWDAYGLRITEPQFRDNVAVLAKTLKPFGWTYAVIDEGWFMENPQDRGTPEKLRYVIDRNGRYIPDPVRFPSALQRGHNAGFAALAASVHRLGIKFGIHIVRGIPRQSVALNLPVAGSRFTARDVADTADACSWDPTNWGVKDNAAGQAWYDSLVAQYAQWGVDYLKVDCIANGPYKATEIRMIHRAIAKSGRPIVLSLSPGPTALERANEVAANAQLWRISDDVWDVWFDRGPWPHGIQHHFDLVAKWAPYARPGSWPDADMLPLGYLGPTPGWDDPRQTRLTPAEQRTVMTLWAIARSPLILGANLTRLDPATLALITNRTVIDLDQYGQGEREVRRDGPIVAWTSTARGKRYLALFNTAATPTAVRQNYASYGLADGYRARDVWEKRDLGRGDGVDLTLPPHGAVLLELAR
jgi:alpha-galactosidase